MPGDHDIRAADQQTFGRKAFLGGSLLVVGGVALGRVTAAGAAPSTTLDGFLELSRVVTGVEKLPRGLASEYLHALDAAPQLKLRPTTFVRLAGYTNGSGPADVRALERSAAFNADGGKQCVEAILAAWWSGIVPIAGGQRVVTFDDALVWREVHEPTTCQGATGSWAHPGRAAL